MRGVDYVFHAAALKQVPSCEFHPMEAVRTNVLGTENVLEAAIAAGVQARGVPEHGQGGVPHQRHGHQQGHDGKGDGGSQPQPGRHQHGYLRHPLRQCDGVARLGDSAVCGAGAGRQAHYGDRPVHDALHDDAGRRG